MKTYFKSDKIMIPFGKVTYYKKTHSFSFGTEIRVFFVDGRDTLISGVDANDFEKAFEVYLENTSNVEEEW